MKSKLQNQLVEILNNKIDLHDLNGLSKTSIIPLWVRWADYKSNNPILGDELSYQILESSNFDKTIFDDLSPIEKKYTQLGIIIRENIFDDYINHAINSFEDANVVNFGCGLDPRFNRIKNLRGIWYDLDLESIIKLKSDLFTEKYYHTIAADMFDISWMNSLDPDKPHIFFCEGTLMYFSEEKVLHLIKSIKKRFPKNVMIFEIMGSFGRNKIHPFIKRLKLNHKYQWGINSLKWFSKNDINLKFYNSFLDYHSERWGFIANLVNISSYLKLNIASQIYYIEND